MASATRTIRVRFDGSAKGLIAAAAQAGIAVEGFEKQVKKSAVASTSVIGTGLIDALGSLPSVLKGAAIVAAAGIGAVMAPALASAIISGVLLAVGAGVLAAGIIGAAKSPKVVKAWQRFAKQAQLVFERFSKPFIQPLLRAVDTFSRALRRAEPTIQRIGQTMAPFVDSLALGVALLVEKLLPGILSATEGAQPFISILAFHLPLLGEAMSRFFAIISAGSGPAEVFFDRFLFWVEDIIPKLGGFLVWLSDLGVKMEAFANSPQFLALKDALTKLKDDTLAGVKTGFDNIKISIASNSETWQQLGKDINTVIKDLGPVVKWFADLVGESIGAAIDWFATLYNGIKKVVEIIGKAVQIVDALRQGLNKLPGNLSGNGTHVQLGTIERRAYGGPAIAGRSYVVGDGGEPEIFTPGATGFITPMSKAAGSSGAAPIIVENHIEIGGEVVRVVRTEIRESDRRLKRAVLAGAGAR